MKVLSSDGEGFKHIQKVEVPDKVRHRIFTGLPVIDKWLGGGLVAGEVLLFGGEPGAGKTTLLLQVISSASDNGIVCIYNSAEEYDFQVKMAIERIGSKSDFLVGNISDVSTFIAKSKEEKVQLLVVDSIQGLVCEDLGNAGRNNHVMEALNRLVQYAKSDNVALVIICQLNKDGSLSGPNVIRHEVDACGLLYENKQKQKVIELEKNRFGPSGIIVPLVWADGKYDLDITEEEEEEDSLIDRASMTSSESMLKPHLEIGAPIAERNTNESKLQSVRHAFSRCQNKDAQSLLHCFLMVRRDYGSIRLQTSSADILGVDPDQWQRFLLFAEKNSMFNITSVDPLELKL